MAGNVKLESIKKRIPLMSFGKSQGHSPIVAGKVFKRNEQSAHICLILLLSQASSAVLLKTGFRTDRSLI